jgi:hypothetical protein
MINWLISHSRAPVAAYIAASVIPSGAYMQVVLRFSKEAQSDLRFIKGDRLIIGFDEVTKQICFKRTAENNGHKLTGGKKNGTVLHVQVTVKNRHLVKAVAFDKQDLISEPTHYSINAPQFFTKQI